MIYYACLSMLSKKTSSLSSLFAPRSIAIIGASRHPKKIGRIVLDNLRHSHYRGEIFPINPEAASIDQYPAYPRVSALPKIPDLAIIAIPAPGVAATIESAAIFGIKNFVIFSAGFKEIGSDGALREEHLRALADTYHLNILGPNCLGFFNSTVHLNATFGSIRDTGGNVRCLSQSGAMASSMFDWAKSADIGLSQIITLGNKAVLTENDILEHWLHEPIPAAGADSGLSSISPIAMYLESITDGERFMSLAKQLAKKHPLFLLKPGKSAAAQHAIQSHTGAMAQADNVLDAALRESGVIRCEGVEDLFDLTRAFAWENAPTGPRVAIVSNAGGPAVIATDLVADYGLTLAKLGKKTHDLLATHLPREANITNPIDVLGDALGDRYHLAIDTVLAERSVDAAIAILTPQVMTDIDATARAIVAASKKYRKPILAAFMGGSRMEKGENILSTYRIPSFRYPERAVKTLGAMWRWQSWRAKHARLERKTPHKTPVPLRRAIEPIIREARMNQHKALSTADAAMVLSHAGVPLLPSKPITSVIDGAHFANRHDYPVVLKISSPAIIHKTDDRAVVTDINNPHDLHAAVRHLESVMRTKHVSHDPSTSLYIQKQIQGGIEVIIGMKRDPQFGPVWLFGAGGILAELTHDQVLRTGTLGKREIAAMIDESRVSTLLAGYRGERPYAISALIDLIHALMPLATIPDILEMEINPVIVTEKAAYAVDSRIILHPSPRSL